MTRHPPVTVGRTPVLTVGRTPVTVYRTPGIRRGFSSAFVFIYVIIISICIYSAVEMFESMSSAITISFKSLMSVIYTTEIRNVNSIFHKLQPNTCIFDR